jgi:hypothetical protein
MRRATLFKAIVITIFALPSVGCSGPATDPHAAGTDAVGSLHGVANPPAGIMNRDEYEHSPSFPPG